MTRRHVVRPGDSMATAWLKKHPKTDGFWTMFGLRAQTEEVVVRLFRFPDGSILESVNDGGDITDWRAFEPGAYDRKD